MYAVIDRGGKQMRVETGQVLDVDRLPAEKGAEVVLGRVLMLVDAGDVRCGTPVVEGAQVVARVLSHGRTRKVTVGKFRPKKHYRRRVGHRQPLSRVRIERIDVNGGTDRGA
jgi:large subunit ribosomal protein L21